MLKNVLDIPVLGPLIQSPWTWRIMRTGMLLLLLAMIAFGWPYHDIPGVPVRDPLMYTNFATFNLWVLWLMGMVPIALLLGRSWCTVCPVGWLNGLFSKVGLRRELPGWLDNLVPVTLLLVALQFMVYFFAIHRFPDYTAILLSAMLVFAVILGLIFRKRAFCELLCPAGAVFNLYARLAPWQLRVKDRKVCDGCHDKPCIATEPVWKKAALGPMSYNWRAQPEGCPVDLVLAEIDNSATCTLCLNCMQTCCNDNIKIGMRGFLADIHRGVLAKGAMLFTLVLLGLLTANFAKVYVDLREMIFWVPEHLSRLLNWTEAGFYPLAVLWIGIIFPCLLLLPGLIVYLVGQVRISTLDSTPPATLEGVAKVSLWQNLVSLGSRFILPLLPLVLAAHLVLALVKLNAKLGYATFALQDPSGVKGFLAINVMKTMSPPGALIPIDLLKWAMIGLLALGFAASVYSAIVVAKDREKTNPGSARSFFAGGLVTLVLLSGIYGATVMEWLFRR